MDTAGMYAQINDLRLEPMYRASAMSRVALREEIVSRFVILRSNHHAAGRTMPRSSEIDEAVARIVDSGSPLGFAMPGPLEGHRRPSEFKERILSEPDMNSLMEELEKDPCGTIWSKLAYFSQYFALGDKILARAREASARVALDVDLTERDKRLNQLMAGCLVAAANRDTELARSISAKALSGAHLARSDKEAIKILHILLQAGASFEREDEWALWIEDQLASLAARLPTGEAVKSFLEHLREIKKVFPLTHHVCSRAEALASAAG